MVSPEFQCEKVLCFSMDYSCYSCVRHRHGEIVLPPAPRDVYAGNRQTKNALLTVQMLDYLGYRTARNFRTAATT